MSTYIQSLFCLTIMVCINGCSEHKQIAKDLDTYANRLQSYTDIKLINNEFSYHLNAPAKLEFRQGVAERTINLRELHALNGCFLNQLIAQRNTALGKMQLPSARYAYESQLIVALTKCAFDLQNDTDNSPLIQKLNLWKVEKQSQLPFVWANLITQSSEVYTHLTIASGFISGNASDNLQATKQALRFLLNAKTAHPINLSELELHLQQLANSPLLAQKWRTQLLLTHKLNQVSLLLIEFLKNNQCQTLQQKQTIEIMQNIFRKLFAQSIQGLAGELNNYHYQLTPLIEQLALSPYFTKNLGAYLTRHNEINYRAYTHSMQKHIGLWQDIFGLCS